MRLKMSMNSRAELIDSLRESYHASDHKQKVLILNHLVEATGYNRKYVTSLLASSCTPNLPAKRNRERVYDDAFKEKLEVLWLASNRLCSNRFVAALPLLLEALERHKHIEVSSEHRKMLLSVSAATVDRLLKDTRKRFADELKRTRQINRVRTSI